MKVLLILVISTFFLAENVTSQFIKCDNKGCYEVIKVFRELLTAKISESDALLAAAESELNIEKDSNFNEKIKEVDTKLASLILELTTGTHQINNISIDLQKIENLLESIETETESSQSSIEAFDRKFKDMNELIREIQDEMARINNATSYDGPSALQDASDRSETLDADTLELKSILNEAQSIIAAYEKNLINAKLLTQQTLERLGEVERKIDETKSAKSEHAEGIAKLIDMKTARAELKNTQKLTRESLDETRKVSDEAFEQFVKVEIAIATDRRFKLAARTSDISENVEEMQTLVDETMKSLNGIVEQNSDLLKEIEETIERAKNVEEKAAEVQRDVDVKLELIQRLHADSETAVRNKNYVVDNARFILRRLDNFKFRLEDEIIMARRSMEKFDRVSKKVQETMKMIEKIEEKSIRRHESATSAHDSSTTAKDSALKNLISSQQLKSEAHKLKSHVNEITDEASNGDEQTTSLNIAIDKLEGRSVDDSKLIEMTKEILARTWQKVNEADEAIGDVQSKLEMMLAEVSGSRSWDDVDGELDELERQLEDAERLLNESEIHRTLRNLHAQRHEQNIQLENYKLEIAEMESQLFILRENADSLKSGQSAKCYKRTRLEPSK